MNAIKKHPIIFSFALLLSFYVTAFAYKPPRDIKMPQRPVNTTQRTTNYEDPNYTTMKVGLDNYVVFYDNWGQVITVIKDE